MAKIPEDFVAAAYYEGDGSRPDEVHRSIRFSECRLFWGVDRWGNEVERADRRPMYEVRLTRHDRKAREALKEMTGARWDRANVCWLVTPERVTDLITWAEQFMAGGAWTDAEAAPEWRGIIGDAEPVQPYRLVS